MGNTAPTLPAPEALEAGQNIQIWMPSKHMGNLLLSLRSVVALVEHYGAHRCTLVADESYRSIIDACPLAVPVIYFPRRAIDACGPWGKVRRTLSFIARTRKPKPYIAIAVEGEKVSQRFMPLSGCRISVGPDNQYCRRYRVRLPLDHGKHHVFHDYAAVAEKITGTAPAPGYPLVKAGRKERVAVKELLDASLERPTGPYAVLHPCATKDYKQWPVESFARVAEYLAEQGMNVIVTGAGDFDRQTITRLLATGNRPLLSLHDRLNLGELVALLARARLFVGNDTGPTHLAAATGIPTFALFGPTNEFLWGPLGDNVSILRSDVPCEPDCLRRRCPVNYRCMRTLAPETVAKQLGQWH